MSTRSLTIVEDMGARLCVMYRSADGSPTEHGQDLKACLGDMLIAGGPGLRLEERRYVPEADGMGCLAAQLVGHFKEGEGGIYLCPSTTVDAGQDYTYLITQQGDRVALRLLDAQDRTLYDGLLCDFDPEAAEQKEATVA